MKTFSITLDGAVWGNRSDKDAAIKEVEGILARCKEMPGYGPAWLYGWSEFDAEGKNRWTKVPATVEIEEDAKVFAKGTVVARWVGGERTL